MSFFLCKEWVCNNTYNYLSFKVREKKCIWGEGGRGEMAVFRLRRMDRVSH